MPENPKLIDKWSSLLPSAARNAVQILRSLADRDDIVLYLVGGPLRDLLLGLPSLDIDIAVESDAAALARALATAVGGRVTAHPSFGTATVRASGITIDLATTRSESYSRPGALPTIRPAAIEDDLRRRDFTINAMALRLSGPSAGELLDPTGGRGDLQDRLVRSLHEHSFQDDATRILRAVRYGARFRFRIEEQTHSRLKRDLAYLETISGARLHHEFVRIFAEAEPEATLRRLAGLGALRVVHPALEFREDQADAFRSLRELRPPSLPAAYWALLGWPLQLSEAEALAFRLALPKAQRVALASMPFLRELQPELARAGVRRSRVADLLGEFPPSAIWALAAIAPPPVRGRCLDYVMRARFLKTALDGVALLEMGVPPGPDIGEVLRRLRVARLDGELKSRRDEERFVQSLMTAARSIG